MIKFKKPYMSKNWKKIFEAKSPFILFWISQKLQTKVKVILTEERTGKKITTCKFTAYEYALIHQAAVSKGMTDEEFFIYIITTLK
jgi:hypothetical protein